MKSLRNKVILSGIVLLFAFIATIGSTYAWFTVSSEASVDTLTLNVTAQEGLLIQVRGYDEGASTFSATVPTLAEDFQTFISLLDFTEAGYTSIESYRIQPVTSIATYADGIEGFGSVDLANLYTIDQMANAKTVSSALDMTATNKTGIAGRYVELQFYVRYQGEPLATKDVLLSNFSIIRNSELDNADVASAVRLSVNSNIMGDTPRIYGLTKDYGFAYTSSYIYYVTTPVIPTAFNGLGELNMLDGSENLVAGVTNSAYIHTLTEIQTPNSNPNLFTLTANVTSIVTVRIYIEGWANATTDSIIASAFDINFSFAFA